MGTVNVLQYLLSKTQIDIDSLDLPAAQKGGPYGPWADATSNQAEVFSQITAPQNAPIVARAITLGEELQDTFPEVTLPELMVEVATVLLAARVLPFISGNVHVMANPCFAFSTKKVIETGKRYHRIFSHIQPNFDSSRVVMKVPGTYEGLRACRELKAQGIKTLSTTVFTMEQVILAGEAGCVSISPFVHELKMGFDATYQDHDPLLGLCVKAQQYYEDNSIPTRVKACCCISIEEILQLGGVTAHTLEPGDLDTLASMREDEKQLNSRSLFARELMMNGVPKSHQYLDNEAAYRADFANSEGGKGQFKLFQAISIFSDFQKKAELKMSGLEVPA